MKTLCLGLLALTLAGCGAQGASHHLARGSANIVGGQTDNGDDAVVYISSSTGFTCSGTLIAPDVVLTAAHCTVTDENCTQPNCQELAANGFTVSGGVSPAQSADWQAGVTEVHTDPAYDGAGFTGGDTGILVLDQDAPVAPMAWLRAGNNDAIYADGAQVEKIGYGLANAPSGPDTSGTKRSVMVAISAQTAADYHYGSAQANSCDGDSGGPAVAMLDDGPVVVGVTSWGDDNCQQFGVDVRTDASDAFIAQYAAASGTTSGGSTGGTPTPTPAPTGTPGNPGNGGNNGTTRPIGCDVGGAMDGGPLAAMLLGSLVLVSRRRRATR